MIIIPFIVWIFGGILSLKLFSSLVRYYNRCWLFFQWSSYLLISETPTATAKNMFLNYLYLNHNSSWACLLYKSFALDKDLRISVVIMPPPVWDVIPLAGNKASLLPVIGQICSCTKSKQGGWGHLSHSHFRTVQPAHVQYILGAAAIDLCFSFQPYTNTLPLTSVFVSALRSWACLSALADSMTM